MEMALIVLLLSIMEVSFSFDNAVVNASVLKDMDEKWQKRFLTWGILVAVVGMRLVFPILIVSAASGLGIPSVIDMAITDGKAYGEHLTAAHDVIAAFGGMFLLMVFLDFIIDQEKEVHWIHCIEKHAASLTWIFKAGICCILFGLFWSNYEILIAGGIGVLTYLILNVMSGTLSGGAKAGIMGFLYLEVLDASFSLDGVIGAFAMTNNIIVIMIGLGIGSAVIRTLTVRLVRGKTLQEYIYLEHGAHWGIAALSAIMLTSIWMSVPEVVTGLVGVGFIGLSLLSSIKHKRGAA